jgi:hypothetical protein
MSGSDSAARCSRRVRRPAQLRNFGIALGDLFRTPLQLQLGLHDCSQLLVASHPQRPRPTGPLPGPGEIGVIAAVVVRRQVPPQLPAHRRR